MSNVLFRRVIPAFLFALLYVSPLCAEVFKVGMPVCLTGSCADWGKNSFEGAQLAARDLNDNGGVLGRQVVLVTQNTDEAISGAMAVSAFRNLMLDKRTRYFLGPTWSPAGLALAPIVAKMPEVLFISPSVGVAEFDKAADNIFNVWPHDVEASKAAGRFAVRQGWKRVAILSSVQPWAKDQGDAIESEVKRAGGQVVLKEETSPDVVDLRAEALRVKAKNPDVVFVTWISAMSEGTKALRRIGYKGQFISILMDKAWIETSEGALEGAIISKPQEPAKDFVAKFNAMHGHKPGNSADTAYDAMMMLGAAIAEAGTFDVTKVKTALAKQKYSGASGEIVFDEFGGVMREPAFYVVRGLALEPYTPALSAK